MRNVADIDRRRAEYISGRTNRKLSVTRVMELRKMN